MARFFVGQRVRIVRSSGGHAGKTGRVSHLGYWEPGDVLPSGRPLWKTICGYVDTYVIHDTGGGSPAHSTNLEPILPDGLRAGDYSNLRDLMDALSSWVNA